MPVISSRHFSPSLQSDGNTRYRFAFTFDDGRPVELGSPLLAADAAAADVIRLAMIPDIEASMVESDSERAVDNESDIADSGQATLKQVARQYFKRAMQETNLLKAYWKLKKINDYITAQGWTAEQVKNQLNLTDNQWSRIVTRWQYFQANSVVIEAFAALVDPQGDF